MPYSVIDHTADTGVRVWAADPAALFSEAARAMFEQITDPGTVMARHCRELSVNGFDRSDLLVSWLKELLYLWSTQGCLVKSTAIKQISDSTLSAEIFYDVFDPQVHAVETDIKAVTYYGLAVEEVPGGFSATIIFDV